VTCLHLTQRRSFVADHFHDLPGFQEARHGHNWELQATVALPNLDQETRLDQALEQWVRQVDYALLNEIPWMEGRNPTTEVLAGKLYEFLEHRDLAPVCVKIREKENYWASCRRESR
jgi:6-pyruvoyl-tetrahydropterin synthase